jgi:NADH:ubiquinone oxidoreductase subunit 6 (subunit J)
MSLYLFAAAPSVEWIAQALLVLPLVLGAVGVYLLLPQPRAARRALAAVLALAGLVATAFYVPTEKFSTEAFLFYSFSALALIAGGLLVTQSNPARAALAFAVVVLSVCGLFLLQAAPFLMAATIIIYAGAIVVTFLFVLMLAQQEGPSDADARSREPLLATLTGFLLFGVLVYVLQGSYGTADLDQLIERTRAAGTHDSAREINQAVGPITASDGLYSLWQKYLKQHAMKDLAERVAGELPQWVATEKIEGRGDRLKRLDQLLAIGDEARMRLGWFQPGATGPLPLSNLSGPAADEPPANLRRDEAGRPVLPADNSAYLGRSLFTDFLLPVELGGALLLAAAVGAIAMAQRRAGGPAAARRS